MLLKLKLHKCDRLCEYFVLNTAYKVILNAFINGVDFAQTNLYSTSTG